MKNQFDFKRFGRYFLADFNNCIANYGLSLLIVSLMGLIVVVFCLLFSMVLPNQSEHLMPGQSLRVTMFCISLVVLMLSMPSKCYGGLTDKRMGTAFLMLPVSRLEKFLSMLLNMLVVLPAAFLIISLGVDSLICLFVPESGTALISAPEVIRSSLDMAELPENFHISRALTPWLMLDDIWTSILIFLLGAIWFKNGKISKTLGTVILVSLVLSLIATPILVHYFNGTDLEAMMKAADTSKIDWILRILEHPVLWETLADTLVNLLLCAGIFWRMKTLKH